MDPAPAEVSTNALHYIHCVGDHAMFAVILQPNAIDTAFVCLSSLTSRLLKILQLVIKFPLQAQGVGLFRFSLGLWHSLRTKYNLLPFLARW